MPEAPRVSPVDDETLREPDMPEIAWSRSSYCQNHACVEIAATPGRVAVRDSKDVSRGALAVPVGAWRRFLSGLAEAGDRPH